MKKMILELIPSRENAPSLYEGNRRHDLLKRRAEAAAVLTEETTSTKESLSRRRAARRELADVYSDADDLGLWVGQESLTGKTQKDKGEVQSAATRLSVRRPSLADIEAANKRRGEADAAASASGKTAN